MCKTMNEIDLALSDIDDIFFLVKYTSWLKFFHRQLVCILVTIMANIAYGDCRWRYSKQQLDDWIEIVKCFIWKNCSMCALLNICFSSMLTLFTKYLLGFHIIVFFDSSTSHFQFDRYSLCVLKIVSLFFRMFMCTKEKECFVFLMLFFILFFFVSLNRRQCYSSETVPLFL